MWEELSSREYILFLGKHTHTCAHVHSHTQWKLFFHQIRYDNSLQINKPATEWANEWAEVSVSSCVTCWGMCYNLMPWPLKALKESDLCASWLVDAQGQNTSGSVCVLTRPFMKATSFSYCRYTCQACMAQMQDYHLEFTGIIKMSRWGRRLFFTVLLFLYSHTHHSYF